MGPYVPAVGDINPVHYRLNTRRNEDEILNLMFDCNLNFGLPSITSFVLEASNEPTTAADQAVMVSRTSGWLAGRVSVTTRVSRNICSGSSSRADSSEKSVKMGWPSSSLSPSLV